jgi:hypothetical protein
MGYKSSEAGNSTVVLVVDFVRQSRYEGPADNTVVDLMRYPKIMAGPVILGNRTCD